MMLTTQYWIMAYCDADLVAKQLANHPDNDLLQMTLEDAISSYELYQIIHVRHVSKGRSIYGDEPNCSICGDDPNCSRHYS